MRLYIHTGKGGFYGLQNYGCDIACINKLFKLFNARYSRKFQKKIY